MFTKPSFVVSLLAIFVLSLTLTGSIFAQSKTKTVAKKAETHKKDAKKDREKTKLADAKAKKDPKKLAELRLAEAEHRQKDAKKDREKGKVADAKGKKDPKKLAELRRAEAERRQRDAERRQAILAEQRRREQAIREARARKIAFERGLRTETIANISNDVTDGEDLNIRAAAVNALGSHAGSIVVMEAQTGKVLTIVNQDWAIRSSIRPCSTVKLVTGVAALNENVISKEDGSIRNTPTRLNLDDALAFSNNGYFQRAGSNVGSAKLIEYAKQLGLGHQTGLNADGEVAGKLPYGNNNLRIYSHGDDFEVSTVQLAVMVSAITNGGKLVLPRIPRNGFEQTNFRPLYRERLNLPQQNVRRVIPGMIGSAEYGTSRRGVDASLGIAGKTGSCISKGSWVGLYTSVAPIEQPKYAVAVITRGQRERGRNAAAVAGQIYNALSRQIVRTNRNLALTEFKINPRKSFDTTTAVKMADEEGNDEAGGGDDFPNDGRETIVVPSAPRPIEPERPLPKKLVTKTADSRPLFPPVIIIYDRTSKGKKRTGNKPE